MSPNPASKMCLAFIFILLLSLSLSLSYSHIQLYVYIYKYKRKHNDKLQRTNEHNSLEKYTSHTLFSKELQKGWCWLCVRGELETESDCHILTPSSSDYSSTHSAGLLNWGPEGPSPLSGAGSHSTGILSPTATGTLTWTARKWLSACLELQLTKAICGTWLYNCLTPTYFLWAYTSAPNSATSTGQGSILISLNGCTCFLIDSSVKGQYVTSLSLYIYIYHGLALCKKIKKLVVYVDRRHTYEW